MSLESGVRVGKYVVGRKLGQGGFGILHVARDTELDREVAIKFLKPEHAFKPAVVQRFLQEARAAARINHPGIVTVHESGIVGGTNTRADGTVYIAMELLSGETLAQRLARSKLPVPVAVGMARQLAAALAAAHASSIVHRDLKPQNVFLVPDPAVVGGVRVKVLDFGIAKLVDDFGSNVQTHSMLMLGTPMYMSPEQCKSSAKVDARSDIYSLGCMLFELVCGQPPFDGDSGELIAKHQLVPPPTARSIVANLPGELDALVTAMLAKSPADRPQTMDAVLDALAQLEGGAGEDAPTLTDAPVGPAPAPDPAQNTTLTEGAASRPSQERRTRRALYLGAATAIALGIIVGIVSVKGGGGRDDTSATTAALGSDSAPAPAIPVDPVPAPAPAVVTIDAAPAPAPADEASEQDSEAVAGKAAVVNRTAAKPRAPAAKTAAGCDGDAYDEKARQDEAIGQHAAALAAFEKAIECKPTDRRYQLAFMSACNAGNADKAREYYTHVVGNRENLAQMCYRNGIKKDMLTATCDPDALDEKAREQEAMSQHAAALSSFEAAIRCKPTDRRYQLAFMSACNAANFAKARLYYKKVAGNRANIAQMCVRNGISIEALEKP